MLESDKLVNKVAILKVLFFKEKIICFMNKNIFACMFAFYFICRGKLALDIRD